jgi:hypothetical protein
MFLPRLEIEQLRAIMVTPARGACTENPHSFAIFMTVAFVRVFCSSLCSIHRHQADFLVLAVAGVEVVRRAPP